MVSWAMFQAYDFGAGNDGILICEWPTHHIFVPDTSSILKFEVWPFNSSSQWRILNQQSKMCKTCFVDLARAEHIANTFPMHIVLGIVPCKIQRYAGFHLSMRRHSLSWNFLKTAEFHWNQTFDTKYIQPEDERSNCCVQKRVILHWHHLILGLHWHCTSFIQILQHLHWPRTRCNSPSRPGITVTYRQGKPLDSLIISKPSGWLYSLTGP